RGAVPPVARPAAGARVADLGRSSGARARVTSTASGGGQPLPCRRAQRDPQLPDPRQRAAENPVYGRGGTARGGGGLGSGARAGRREEASGAAGCRLRGEVAGRGSHALTDTVSLSVTPRA